MKIKPLHVFTGRQRTRVDFFCYKLGNDIQLFILGGQIHIGAVSLAIFNQSKQDAEVSVIRVPGHREDEISTQVAGKLGAQLKTTASVTAGIHYDQLNKEELTAIIKNIHILTDRLINKLSSD
ncbi:MAG: hypothetical protein JXR46_02075 [Calditrichaceae bacterium]|nr:hypothetical protein [Calditrichaceae bacterium]MBN2707808.1 hypothetical protein [Calditrichaceae bacterium]RQV96267.1 MAG: hypothetical protein EH224_04880 [Calditrichota bacterium]